MTDRTHPAASDLRRWPSRPRAHSSTRRAARRASAARRRRVRRVRLDSTCPRPPSCLRGCRGARRGGRAAGAHHADACEQAAREASPGSRRRRRSSRRAPPAGSRATVPAAGSAAPASAGATRPARPPRPRRRPARRRRRRRAGRACRCSCSRSAWCSSPSPRSCSSSSPTSSRASRCARSSPRRAWSCSAWRGCCAPGAFRAPPRASPPSPSCCSCSTCGSCARTSCSAPSGSTARRTGGGALLVARAARRHPRVSGVRVPGFAAAALPGRRVPARIRIAPDDELAGGTLGGTAGVVVSARRPSRGSPPNHQRSPWRRLHAGGRSRCSRRSSRCPTSRGARCGRSSRSPWPASLTLTALRPPRRGARAGRWSRRSRSA